MRFRPTKHFIFACAGLISIVIVFAPIVFERASQPGDIAIQSEESRTIDGKPVFNRIHFERTGSHDIWMMNQSHLGLGASAEQWDRLAIVVDRQTKTARFYQFEPGSLRWSESLKQKEFRVSCAICHANGPRAIRPEPGTFGSLSGITDWTSAQAWAKVSYWNVRVKRYARLQSGAGEDFVRKINYRFLGHFANTPLRVAVCVYCHREDGLIARGTLVRQNALAISKMVENGHMPPLGIPLPASQRAELNRFLRGF